MSNENVPAATAVRDTARDERTSASAGRASIPGTAVAAISGALGLISAVVVAYMGRSVEIATLQATDASRQVTEAIAFKQEDRLATQSAYDLKFKVFDKVWMALEKEDANQQLAAKTLVVALLDPADELRIGLLEALNAGAAPAAQQSLAETTSDEKKYAAAQSATPSVVKAAVDARKASATPQPAGSAGTYFVDVFYCEEGSAENRTVATNVEKSLDGVVAGHRLRPLAKSVNAAPGMRISGLQIRYGDNELDVAKALQSKIGRPGVAEFALQPVRTPTPNYLSAFVCR